MVQLARTVADLPDPVRQLWIEAAGARLDLAWPALGLFVELDGQHHKDQPVYDARRETAVVAATGWLCGRFTWTEVVHLPTPPPAGSPPSPPRPAGAPSVSRLAAARPPGRRGPATGGR
jgi:hypothetical protein